MNDHELGSRRGFMRSVHFDDQVGRIAALPESDPERSVAAGHARSCPRCARALAEASRLLDLVDEPAEASDAAPTPEQIGHMLGRVEARIATEERRRNLGLAVAVVVAWFLNVVVARELGVDHISAAWSVGVLLAAIMLAAQSRKGARMTGIAILLSGLFALSAGTGAAASTLAEIGVKCLVLEMGAAAIPWGVLLWSARGSARRAEGAAVAAAGALAGHAALHLTCPAGDTEPHLLVFHLGGVVLAPALGWLAMPRTCPLSASG